jgi:hypothetical protein
VKNGLVAAHQVVMSNVMSSVSGVVYLDNVRDHGAAVIDVDLKSDDAGRSRGSHNYPSFRLASRVGGSIVM